MQSGSTLDGLWGMDIGYTVEQKAQKEHFDETNFSSPVSFQERIGHKEATVGSTLLFQHHVVSRHRDLPHCNGGSEQTRQTRTTEWEPPPNLDFINSARPGYL